MWPRDFSRLALLLAFVFLPAAALAHARGFHKRLVMTVDAKGVRALVTMDVDEGKRTQVLRSGSDLNRDGRLGAEEIAPMREKLATLATGNLRVTVAGYPLRFEREGAKIDLRGVETVSSRGVSVAVLLRSGFPERPVAGVHMEVQDDSPDRSHIAVEVHQQTDRGAERLQGEIVRGRSMKVRLGGLVASLDGKPDAGR